MGSEMCIRDSFISYEYQCLLLAYCYAAVPRLEYDNLRKSSFRFDFMHHSTEMESTNFNITTFFTFPAQMYNTLASYVLVLLLLLLFLFKVQFMLRLLLVVHCASCYRGVPVNDTWYGKNHLVLVPGTGACYHHPQVV